MKADFICTLNKLLEEKHIHFNAYCWILKYVFPYIKNSFKKKKMNLVFAPKLCRPWELALCNVMCLKQLGSWYRCWGCRSGRWFRGAPRTRVAPPFPGINPEAPGGGSLLAPTGAMVHKQLWLQGTWARRAVRAVSVSHTPNLFFLSWYAVNPNGPVL